MSRLRIGLFWAILSVGLEAIQAVFFGGIFQAHDSFVIGALVFGTTSAATLAWTQLRTPDQLNIAWSKQRSFLGLSLSMTIVWIAYFFALQIIEPAVIFMVFSGLIPLSILAVSRLGVPEATTPHNGIEKIGLAVIGLGVIYLWAITILSHSGFVRGGLPTAIIGLFLSATAAISLAVMMIYVHRLDRLGIAPIAQYGLRFPLYIIFSLCAIGLGIDAKGAVDTQNLAVVVLVGLVVIAFPVFAMQKAISMLATGTLATITALGPLAVFVLQFVEGRVGYATATMKVLAIYILGALLAAFGGAQATTRRKVSS
jgi:drug/metabolite transporter (DMT)-like permease